MPEISIIIPAYNASKTMAKCLNSIFRQSYKNFEIIIVNDGSTDETQKILDNIKKQPHNVTLNTIENKKNLGAAAARNVGAAKAQGNFLLFCDADIILQPIMLEIMLNELQRQPQASYIYSSFKFGWKNFRLWPFDPQRLKKMPYIHTTSLMRKEHFPGFDESLKRFQDWDLWLTMLENNHAGYFIPQILFTVLPGGTMSAWLPKFFYNIPWKFNKVKRYEDAQEIIRKKHNL